MSVSINLRIRFFIVVAVFMAMSVTVLAGPYYVVVGTFSDEGRAVKFATAIRQVFPEASFRFDGERKYYHVYVKETGRQVEAENFRKLLQRDNGFGHAWVYTDLTALTRDVGDTGPTSDDIRLELYTGGTVLLASSDNSHLSIQKNYTNRRDSAQSMARSFKFVAETTTGRGLPAEITLVSANGGAISSFRSAEVVTFSSRESRRLLTLVCKSPGYGTVTRQLDMGDLDDLRDIHQNSDGVWEVRFPMTKIKVDDIKLLYNSIFVRDAAVLRSGAKEGMDHLVTLLRENPEWKIVINSHCNAGAKRDITVPGEGEYFDLAQGRKRPASDKQLTMARTETIRNYLVDHGVDNRRISLMAWGSLDTIVQPTAAKAYMNDRVEVAVISNQQ